MTIDKQQLDIPLTSHRRTGAAVTTRETDGPKPAPPRTDLRPILANAFSMVATTAVTSVVGSAYWVVAARFFPASSVGVAVAAISSMTLLATISVLGFGTSLVRDFQRFKGKEWTLISTALLVTAIVGGLLGAVYASIAPIILPNLAELGSTPQTIAIFALGVSLTASSIVLDQALIGLLRGGVQFARNLLFSFAKLAILAVVGMGSETSQGMAIYVTWGLGMACSIEVIALYLLLRSRRHTPFLPSLQLLRGIGGAALSHHFLNLALQAPSLLLPVFVTVLLSAQLNAAFYIAWMVAGFVFIGPRSLAVVLYAISSREPHTVSSKTRLTLLLSISIGALANVLLVTQAETILRFFSAQYAHQAASSLRLLGLAVFPLMLRDHYVTIARVQDRIRRAIYLIAPGAVLEVLAAAVGAHYYGLFGLCTGWIIAIMIEASATIPAVDRVVSSRIERVSEVFVPWELDPTVTVPRLVVSAGVRRRFPDDNDDYRGDYRDQSAQRGPLSATRPPNRRDDRREDRSEDARAAQPGLSALSPRKRVALTGLALAALLVTIVVIAAEAQLVSRPQTSLGPGAQTQATPTAIALPQPTATPTFNPAPVNPSALGWFRRIPSWAERITTAPSAPKTVYACGGRNSGTAWVISFGISGDGGRTWATATTSMQAAHCYNLAVSPTAPQAIAIETDTCPSDCGQSLRQAFYSLDAGKHWSPISSSCACSQPPDDGFVIGWVGTTLFAIPGTTAPPPGAKQYLAKSTNGGPFTWLNLPVDNQPSPIFTTNDTIYAVRNSDVYTSSDLGSTWTKVSAAYNGNPVSPVAMAPGAVMLGMDARWQKDPNPTSHYPLLSSTDGGATWHPEPELPAGMRITGEVCETPDGSVYLAAIGLEPGQGGIYKLSPGASQWRLLSPVLPGDLRMMAVTWDANGHPATLWGLTPAHPGTSSGETLLWAHSA